MNKNSLLSKSLMNSVTSIGYNLFRYALLIGVSYVAIFPIIKMLSASLTIAEDYYAGVAEYVPPRPTFINYKNVQSYFNFWDCVKVTLIITVSCTLVSVFICSLVGYGLGRYSFKGSNLVYAAVLFASGNPEMANRHAAQHRSGWPSFQPRHIAEPVRKRLAAV